MDAFAHKHMFNTSRVQTKTDQFIFSGSSSLWEVRYGPTQHVRRFLLGHGKVVELHQNLFEDAPLTAAGMVEIQKLNNSNTCIHHI